jgi:hypothetical protein
LYGHEEWCRRSRQEPSLPAKAGNPVHAGDYRMPPLSRLSYAHIFLPTVSIDEKCESFQWSLTDRAQGVSETGII